MPEAQVVVDQTVDPLQQIDLNTPQPPPAKDLVYAEQVHPNEVRLSRADVDPGVAKKETSAPTLPEKFKTVDELVKAYGELEKKFATPQGSEAPKPNAEAPLGVKLPEPPPQLPFEKYATEVATSNTLSPESLKELAKAGIPKEIALSYVQGQAAIRQASADRLVAEIGGAKVFKEMSEWATTNLSKDEMAAYNRAVTIDEPTAKLAVAGLKAKFEASNGRTPKLVQGEGARESAGDAYGDTVELRKDIENPLYKISPAFRSKVEAKLARSSIFKVS